MLRRFCQFFHIAALFLCLIPTIFQPWDIYGQDFYNLGHPVEAAESTFFIRMAVEFMENERKTEESNYPDVYQKNSQRKGRGNLDFYLFHLDAQYKGYDSKVSVDKDETSMVETRDSISAWLQFFTYVYVFGQQKNLLINYEYLNNSVLNFHEQEEAGANTQGFGLIFDEWRIGFSPNTSFAWSYEVDMLGQSLIDEEIVFDLNVFEIVKKAKDRKGLYFELELKEWLSKKALDNRTGSLENREGLALIGLGFSKYSVIYFGEKISIGSIETNLLTDDSRIIRETNYNNSIFGVEFGFGEESSIYIEKQYLQRKIDFKNVAFESMKKSFEDRVTIGISFSAGLGLELHMAKTIVEKDYSENVIANQTASFKQTDNLIGISMEFEFFN